MPPSSTATIIAALRILARDIQSQDGIANAAIAEAADRLEEIDAENQRLQSGGCARNQSTTQFCAEAADFAKKLADLTAAVIRLRDAKGRHHTQLAATALFALIHDHRPPAPSLNLTPPRQ